MNNLAAQPKTTSAGIVTFFRTIEVFGGEFERNRDKQSSSNDELFIQVHLKPNTNAKMHTENNFAKKQATRLS